MNTNIVEDTIAYGDRRFHTAIYDAATTYLC
jgi:hypothetical protein